MFETLDQQIEESEGGRQSIWKRVLRYAEVFAVTLVVFGALYMGIRWMG